MNINKILGLSIFLFIGIKSFGQTNTNDTIYTLKEIIVTSNRLHNFSAGTKVNVIDSLSLSQYSNQNLSDLLINESHLFIKSYSLGALATSTFRGGSANHTAVLWNGFNINSPMNGQLDLSLVPVNFSDAISIQYGGTSALWGSGAVGGAIHLINNAKFNTGLTTKINLSVGSFDNYNQQTAIEFSKKRFISSIKLFNARAKNNFQYTNIFSSNNSKVTQSNAELSNYGLLSENYFLIKKNQKINLFFWYQHTDRNIPPTMLQLVNKSNQVDDNCRITSEWKYDKKKTTTYIRAAYFNEALIYSDMIYYSIASTNRSQSIITEAETKVNLNKQHFINIGINNTFATALVSNYLNKPQQNRAALFASYLYTNKNEKLQTTVSIRQEIIKNKLIPFIYSVGTNYQLIKCLLLKANISKVYRMPTFNDLYWEPGGNLNLLPESGYSEEIGMKLYLKTINNKIAFSTEPTVFNRNVKNWIIWLSEINYWSPKNIMNVWSRGMETNSTITTKCNKIKIRFSILTNYVVSTNQQAKTANDASVDKQLIYVPMYSGQAKVCFEYNRFVFF